MHFVVPIVLFQTIYAVLFSDILTAALEICLGVGRQDGKYVDQYIKDSQGERPPAAQREENARKLATQHCCLHSTQPENRVA